jgi:low affinity Fe/Cu permease
LLQSGTLLGMLTYRSWLTRLGVSTSHPLAFYVGAWITFDRQSFGWQGAATVATWIMALFIQRAEHRDAQAIHAKLENFSARKAMPTNG